MPTEKGNIRLRRKSIWPKFKMSYKKQSSIVFLLFIGIVAITVCSGCGYKVRSSVGSLPSGAQSIGIPTFKNLTTTYKIEQRITSAVIREMAQKTRSTVNSSNSGVDLVLLGEIYYVNSTPVVFGNDTNKSQTFGSAFMITVQMHVKLMRLKDSAVVWRNDDFLFTERYALNPNVKDFFSEDNPSLDRLAKNFAASLASSILDR
jgi:hypothetical protein